MKTIHSGQHRRLVAKLIAARKGAGLLQREAARLLRVTQSYLSKIESGQVRLDVIQLKKFAVTYRKPLEFFLESPAVALGGAASSGYMVKIKPDAEADSREPVEGSEDTVIAEMDRNGIITYISPSVKNILGYEVGELVGTSVFALVPEELRQARRKFVEDIMKHGQAFYQVSQPVLNKQGRPVLFELNGIPFYDGNCKLGGYRGIYRLCNKNESSIIRWYSALVECSPHGMGVASNGKVRYTNLALQRMLGYTSEEMNGMDILEFFPPGLRPMITARYAARLRGEAVPQSYGTQFLVKGGRIADGILSVLPIRGSDAVPEHVIIVRESAVSSADREELLRRREQAEISNRVKTRYLAEMSHEIRTPLNALKGFSELLAKTGMDDTQREYVGIMQESAETLGILLGDIIDVAKIEMGKMELEEIDFSLREAAESALNLVRHQALAKGLALRLEMDASAQCDMRGDPARVRQILLNLLSNAVKFTHEGEVVLAIACSLQDDGKIRAEISVRDTGMGIPPEAQAKLFEPFTQAGPSVWRNFGGSGLGLGIVRTLSARMGGGVSLKSEPGKGSVFTVTFVMPRAEKGGPPQSGAALIAADKPAKPFSGVRALLVEDNPVNLKLARILLENLGCEVDAASGGAQALEMARAKKYHVVILDMVMPEMSGLETARAMRGRLSLAMPIIALTAAALKEDRDAALAAGINDYITKPIKPAELEEKLARHIVRYG
ncbi:MAG: PAS domain S-box protein [Elusimicrobiales bacterium]